MTTAAKGTSEAGGPPTNLEPPSMQNGIAAQCQSIEHIEHKTKLIRIFCFEAPHLPWEEDIPQHRVVNSAPPEIHTVCRHWGLELKISDFVPNMNMMNMMN